MRVLVADFNMLMSSCIALYNDAIDVSRGKYQNWEGIFFQKNLEPFVEPDFKFVKGLINVVKHNNVEFLQSSKEITEKLKDAKDVDLITIDFYNDFVANNSSLDFSDVDERTWASPLDIKSFRWVKAINSPVDAFCKEIPVCVENMSESEVFNETFDKVFIVDSVYVPFKFDEFLEIIKEVAKKE